MAVLVTGATGFIASHIVDNLLFKGYEVIGTTRTQTKGDNLTKLFKAKYPEGKLTFKAVPVIAAEGAFDSLFKQHTEITQVIHTATGFNVAAKPDEFEDEIYKPAIDGTINVLTSIKTFAPQVENVVITGSGASVVRYPLANYPDRVFTSKDWNPLQKEYVGEVTFYAYIVSKILAERAAIDFVEDNKPNFNLITIAPMYVFGPQVFDELAHKQLLNFSNDFLLSFLRKESDNYTPVENSFEVDVRDVANFHVLAFENQETSAGARIFLSSNHFYDQLLIDIVNEELPGIGYKIKGFEQNVPMPTSLDCSDGIAAIGGSYNFIPLRKTVTDVISQYVKVNGSL